VLTQHFGPPADMNGANRARPNPRGEVDGDSKEDSEAPRGGANVAGSLRRERRRTVPAALPWAAGW